jgi:pre-mRNA-splicing factor SYF1
LWADLCELCCSHPKDIIDLDVDAIIRSGITKYPQEIGALWVALAEYYIHQALFEKARDIYEEGISTVTTVRDFSLIFDSYIQYEESMLTARMSLLDVVCFIKLLFLTYCKYDFLYLTYFT